MKFIGEKTQDGVTRREFVLEVAGDKVPGVVWAPEGAKGARPLILMGHGGSQHKKIGNIASAAVSNAQRFGYATLAIDGPGHGDRVDRAAAEARRLASAETARKLRAGERVERTRDARTDLATKHTAEWKAALDAVQRLDFIGKDQKIGYWGVSMGTRYGVPFVANEPRVTCAIFGLFPAAPGLEAHTEDARRIKIPLLFVLQWNDELFKREQGLALFEAFGSEEKTLHMNPGPHTGIPPREREDWATFWQRHLSGVKVSA